MEVGTNKLELHYWFNDNSHSMDACILNNCERELLGLIVEVANILNVEIIIESEALGEGGLRQIFKVIKKNEKKNAVITTAIIVAIATAIITTPLTSLFTTCIEKLFEDSELVDLEKQKKREEIKKLILENKLLENKLNNDTKIIKKKSNFYNNIMLYPKVTRVSIKNIEDNQNLFKEVFISRDKFHDYILETDELPTKIDENATIEIISPVLKKGKYQWKGIYNGSVLDFYMKSSEFKTLVQTGEIEFKNGTSITCVLEMPCKMDNLGNEIITSYNVTSVRNYFMNNTPIETNEGRFLRRKKEADERQLKLF